MLPPFRVGAGGPVGSGRQYWPWIHQQDWVDLVRFAIRHPAVTGPLDATAPAPVTNAEFARALGRALRRPAVLPARPGIRLEVAAGRDGGGAPALRTSGPSPPMRSASATRSRSSAWMTPYDHFLVDDTGRWRGPAVSSPSIRRFPGINARNPADLDGDLNG